MSSPSMSTPSVAPAHQELTSAERETARQFLKQTLNSAIGATRLLTEAQWNFKPSLEAWSIADILDHVVVVQDRVLGPRRELLATAPPPPAGRDCEAIDAIVINCFGTRLAKFQAPPLERLGLKPNELLDRLRLNYARLADYLDSTPDLRDHAADAPPLRAISKGVHEVMDGYQWILAAAAHTERHAKQMLEVIADEKFPA